MLFPLPAGDHPPIQNRRHNAPSCTEALIERNGDPNTTQRPLVISSDQSKPNMKETKYEDPGLAGTFPISPDA